MKEGSRACLCWDEKLDEKGRSDEGMYEKGARMEGEVLFCLVYLDIAGQTPFCPSFWYHLTPDLGHQITDSYPKSLSLYRIISFLLCHSPA